MSETQNKNYITCKPWQLVLWPCHTTASNFLYIAMSMVSYIATGEYGILVATAGIIATASRMFDGIIDPILAMITDRVHTKFGTVRVLILVGRTIQILSVFGIYFWGVGTHSVVLYILLNFTYVIGGTTSAIATHTGNPVLTTNPKQRPKIFRWMMVYTIFVSTFISNYLSKVLIPKYGSISTAMMQELAIVMVSIVVVFEILAIIAITPVDKPENFPNKTKEDNVKPRDMWELIKGNRALQMYVISGVTDKIATNATGQNVIGVLLYGIVIGNYAFSGSFATYSMIPKLLFVFFGTQIMGKTGSKKAMVTWTSICVGLSLIYLGFMIIADPTQISQKVVPTVFFVVVQIALTASQSMVSATTNSLVPDIVDYELYRSGKFMPGAVGMIYAFIDEFMSSFSNTIVAVLLTMVGYVSVQPQPGDACTTAIFAMTMFITVGLPVIGWVATLIAMRFYPLDAAKMEEVQEHNARLREAQKAAKAE